MNASTSITTPMFRGSYVTLVTPRAVADDSDEKKYSMNIVLPKDSAETKAFIKKLEAAFNASMTEKLGKVYPKSVLKHYPIKDADVDTNQEGDILSEKNPEWEGCYVISASNKRKPGAIDKSGNKLFTDDDLYSGAWYYATVNVYAWSGKTFGKGVSISLNNVLKDHDDDRLSGGPSAESDFKNMIEGGGGTEEDTPPKKAKKKVDPLLG